MGMPKSCWYQISHLIGILWIQFMNKMDSSVWYPGDMWHMVGNVSDLMLHASVPY
jgi:hypothetical protein